MISFDHTYENGHIAQKSVYQLLKISKDIPVCQVFQSQYHDFALLPVLPSTPEIMCLVGLGNIKIFCE